MIKTPLYDWHIARGGRVVDFAGFALPVQYTGILAEHQQCRERAALFDVSHMGQFILQTVRGDAHDDSVPVLELLTPTNIRALKTNHIKYSVLLNDDGGIVDDLLITRRAEDFLLVVNGGTKENDKKYLQAQLPANVQLVELPNALLALQGPLAAAVLQPLIDIDLSQLSFMQASFASINGMPVWLSRTGYTGEDGFEISIAADQAAALADLLCADDRCLPCGLGARDSLRLEAGLCLYGHDLDETTSPIEGNIGFAVSKVRDGYKGAERIKGELENQPARQRVGIIFDGRQPVREGAEVFTEKGQRIGVVTSGTVGPTVQLPIALTYLDTSYTTLDTPLYALVRNKPITGRVTALPFNPTHYYRSKQP